MRSSRCITRPLQTITLVAVLSALAARSADGAGFALLEQTARGLGWAYAGESATAADASTIFFNPAGLTLLEGTQFVSSGFSIIPDASFHNRGSRLSALGGGTPLGGGEGGDASPMALVPAFFFSQAVGPRLRLGLGVTVPFGLSTKYDDGWIGRYSALSSSLETINVNPTVAYRVFPWLSFGAGAVVEYAKARLSNALDMGGICRVFGAAQGLPPAACDALGLPPGKVDGYVKFSGDDWSTGWTFGTLLTPTAHTRIGLSYRSSIHHEITGTATFKIPQPARPLVRLSGALVDTGGIASVDLPERISLGIYHEITEQWAVAGDASWTGWSRFDELRFKFTNPHQPTIVQPENWNDSMRYALGVQWTPNRMWQLRLGTAYDDSPVPDVQSRTPRIPDTSRVWLAFGVGLRVTTRMRFDLGYAHLFSVGPNEINNPDPVTGNRVIGKYSAGANIIGLQGTIDLGWPPFGEPVWGASAASSDAATAAAGPAGSR